MCHRYTVAVPRMFAVHFAILLQTPICLLYQPAFVCFNFSDCRPLWPFEDITPRNTAIKSAEQLEAFLRMVIAIFEEAVPHAHLLERWSYEALHWATSCSSRHYAGRSFQVFRGIRTPLTWTMLSDVLQRFTESVAEQSDDMQVRM